MDVAKNRDHRMPQHVDVFQWIEECNRKSICSVWGCGLSSAESTTEPVPHVSLPFELPFCTEHAADFKVVAKASREGELEYDPDGV